MRTVRISLTLVALTAVPAVALAAGGSGRVLVPGCVRAHYKPRRLILGCDGSNYLKALTWSSWTTRRASGRGIDEINDCMPDCASGHFHAYPVAVKVSRPGRCARITHKVFRHFEFVYGSQHPRGGRIQSGPLPCPA